MSKADRRETLAAFTERAIAAVDEAHLIPPIVYLPRMLRRERSPVRLRADMIQCTVDPPTVKENHVRILQHDPLGFLIAIMHGQPIPRFKITDRGAVEVHYEMADLHTRIQVSKFLANKVTMKNVDATDKKFQDVDEWDALVQAREQAARDNPTKPTEEED